MIFYCYLSLMQFLMMSSNADDGFLRFGDGDGDDGDGGDGDGGDNHDGAVVIIMLLATIIPPPPRC